MKLLLAFVPFLLMFSCGEGETDQITSLLEKKYWTAEDYSTVIDDISYNTEEGAEYPRLNDPKKSEILKKLLNTENFEVVLNDSELGLMHKNNIAEEFFSISQEMEKLYSDLDRQDKFIYGEELAEVLIFSLKVQIRYFELGNENIKENADDPDGNSVLNTLQSNENTCVNNYAIYLDYVNHEKAFNSEALTTYIDGINNQFPVLIKAFPKANYFNVQNMAELMAKKADNNKLKEALDNLINQLEKLNPEEEEIIPSTTES